MPEFDDPIRSIKSYLRRPDRLQVPDTVARNLQEIAKRLARARRIDERLQLSGPLEQLLRTVGLPPA
jgi:hypothetical protein